MSIEMRSGRFERATLISCVMATALFPAGLAEAACEAPQNCTGFLNDRLEIELPLAVDPDDVSPLTALAGNVATLAPLVPVLTGLHASLEPSVPALLAKHLGFERAYTIRFATHHSLAQLIAARNVIRHLPPSVVRRVALVPGASAPEDPYLGGASNSTLGPDTPCGTQWYAFATHVDAAWDCEATGKGVVVADIDWGFAKHHDLDGAYDDAHAFDACHANKLIQDGDPGHGTGVVGLIAARRNDKGIRGVAYEAKIWPIQAACRTSTNQQPRHDQCDQTWGHGNPWAAAITHVIGEPCDNCRKVILLEAQSCCNGNYEASIAVNLAIQAAISANIVVVIAAGNGDRDASCDDLGEPIPPSGAIVVGATDFTASGTPPRYLGSNFGDRILVSAPGSATQDLTTTIDSQRCDEKQAPLEAYTMNFGGTSGAAAKVAGIVALVLQKNPDLRPEDVTAILQKSGTLKITSDPQKPEGVLIDAGAAVTVADPKHCKP